MNERIQELIKQATDIVEVTNPDTDITHQREFFDHVKYTELILQECSKVILEWKKEPFPFDEETAVSIIHEHFGIDLPPKAIKVIKI